MRERLGRLALRLYRCLKRQTRDWTLARRRSRSRSRPIAG
jgi:hypothetical protein